jgi:hypothetical protein
MKHARPLDTTIRQSLLFMGIKEGEKEQAKGMENIFNNIAVQNFSSLEKGRVIQV